MGDYRVSKESLHEDEAMLETDSLVLGSDLGKGWNPVSSQPTTTHRAVNYLLTAALLCSIIVVWLYGATKNGACDAGLNQYYYYCTHVNHTHSYETTSLIATYVFSSPRARSHEARVKNHPPELDQLVTIQPQQRRLASARRRQLDGIATR